MKKQFSQLVAYLIIIYAMLVSLVPVFARLRFFLIFSVVLVLALSFELKKVVRAYLLTVLAIMSLIFTKIIPTPYLSLFNHGLPMSISIVLTFVYILIIFVFSIFIVKKLKKDKNI